MNIKLTKQQGLRLKTAGKLCESDIYVKPKLQKKTAKNNSTITPDEGYAGLSSVVVAVQDGIKPEGTLQITKNGKYDVSQYAAANVGVDGEDRTQLNIAYSLSPPADHGKLWIKSENKASKVISDPNDLGVCSVTADVVINDNAIKGVAARGDIIYIYDSDKYVKAYNIKTGELTQQTRIYSSNSTYNIYDFMAFAGDNLILCTPKEVTKYNVNTKVFSRIYSKYLEWNKVGFADLNGKIYWVGGYTYIYSSGYTYTSQQKIYCYDAVNNINYGCVATLPFAVHGVTACAFDGCIYGFGGCVASGSVLNSEYKNTVFKFDPTDNSVTQLPPLPSNYYNGSAVAAGNKIALIGGTYTDLGYNGEKIALYDPSTGELQFMQNEITSVFNARACISGESIYYTYTNKLFKTDISHELAANVLSLMYSKGGKKLKLINNKDIEFDLNIEKVFIGDEQSKAQLAEAYIYDIEREWAVTKHFSGNCSETSQGKSANATMFCSEGDRLIAAITIKYPEFSVSEGWTLLNTDYADHCISSTPDQYVVAVTKVAQNSVESITVSTAEDAYIAVTIVNIGKSNELTPSVEFYSYNAFNTADYSHTLTRPDGLLIWIASAETFTSSAKWICQSNEEQQSIGILGLKQYVFFDQDTNMYGYSVTYKHAQVSSAAMLLCLKVSGLTEFYVTEKVITAQGWKNLATNKYYDS